VLLAVSFCSFLLFTQPTQAKAPSFSYDKEEYNFTAITKETLIPKQPEPKRVKIRETRIIKNLTLEKPTLYSKWAKDHNISWYGPGFYGKRTACGHAYTKTILGVAHRSLPCGTLVAFRYKNKTITVPVIDRGPYVKGRIWDMSGGLCLFLDHCFTGPIEYKILR